MKTVLWFALVAMSAGKVIFTKVGGKASLECGFNSFKRELVWNYQNALIMSISGKSGLTRRGSIGIVGRSRVRETTLEISKVTEDDAGRFTCDADGNVQQHTLLVVSVSVNPSGVLKEGQEATLRCQVKDLDPKPTVEWKRQDGASYASPTVKLKPAVGSDAGTWVCTVTYDGESHTESLNIEVGGSSRATSTPYNPHNSKDLHKPTGLDRTTDHQPGDAVPLLLLGLSWWVWLAAGVGGLVVIVLMVLVIILCKRVRERKKKFLKMKNTQQPLQRRKYCQCGREAAATKPPQQQGRRREKPSALPLQAC